MSIEFPKFNLGANTLEFTSQDELDAALQNDGKKRFEPGSYKLKVTNPRLHVNKETQSVMCADPTWFNVAVTLVSADGKSKDYFVQVPTTKTKYVGSKGKETLFVFRKFMEFMAALGQSVTPDNYLNVAQKFFGSEEALKKNVDGKEVEVDMGYNGPHAEKIGEEFKIVTKAGDLVDDEGKPVLMPDFASAKVYADSIGLKLTFVEITKLHSNIKPVSTAGWE